MNLLELPPEIFHLIVKTCVTSIPDSGQHSCDIKALQLVNSKDPFKIAYPPECYTNRCLELFYEEVTEALCIIHHSFAFNNLGSISRYFRRWVFSSNTSDNYLKRTIKYVTEQLVKHNDSRLYDQRSLSQSLSLIVSRAAADFMDPGLVGILQGRSRSEVKPPSRDDLWYIDSLDEYSFDQSMRYGAGQTSDAPEHILSAAAYMGNISLVKNLLVQGVDVNNSSNTFGRPLKNAALKGHLEIARLLLNKGADPEGESWPRTEEDRQAVENNYGKEEIDQYFCLPDFHHRALTAVEAAAQKGHKETLQLLLQPKFRVSRSHFTYRRAIVFAAEGGNAEILETLAASADYSTLSERSLQDFWNCALRFAAFYGKTETIPLILNNGAQINHEYHDFAFSTSLGFAAYNGHNKTILLLLQKGADIDGGWDGPLSLATRKGFVHTVELLLNQEATVHPVNSRLLGMAAEYGEADIVRILLKRGIHLDKVESALEWAKSARHGRVWGVLGEFGITKDTGVR